MAASLIMHKRINTTLAKAKALRKYVEPIITRSKEDSTHSRRMVFSYLQDKVAVAELFREVAPKVAERPGGYTRIIKMENRPGDNAEMCMMELVDFNLVYGGTVKEGGTTKKATKPTRRRGGSKKAAPATEAQADDATETKSEAAPKKKTTKSTEAKAPAKKAAPKKKKDE
jgi:large subunit ribosomal protein L17